MFQEKLYLPDRTIEGYDSEDIPFARNPTPKGSISIHMPLVFRGDKEVGECRDEWEAVAA